MASKVNPLGTSTDTHSECGLRRLELEDPLLAGNHFVGMLLWIPVNRAMFTGDSTMSKSELQRLAGAAAVAFLAAYGHFQSKE